MTALIPFFAIPALIIFGVQNLFFRFFVPIEVRRGSLNALLATFFVDVFSFFLSRLLIEYGKTLTTKPHYLLLTMAILGFLAPILVIYLMYKFSKTLFSKDALMNCIILGFIFGTVNVAYNYLFWIWRNGSM